MGLRLFWFAGCPADEPGRGERVSNVATQSRQGRRGILG